MANRKFAFIIVIAFFLIYLFPSDISADDTEDLEGYFESGPEDLSAVSERNAEDLRDLKQEEVVGGADREHENKEESKAHSEESELTALEENDNELLNENEMLSDLDEEVRIEDNNSKVDNASENNSLQNEDIDLDYSESPSSLNVIVEEEIVVINEYVIGVIHPGVIDIKNKLIRLGFGGMNINETYGSFTAQRVSEFQFYYGLPANGVADSTTLEKLDEVLSSPFQEGVSHVDTIGLKEKLVLLGYGGMNINESYGSFTAQRVRQFQIAYGLKAHGIADELTLNKIEEEMLKQATSLQVGDKHSSVVDLKKKLVRLGFGGMNINESYGSFTAQRVSEFQSYYGLPANGVADSNTLEKLDEVLSSPFQEGVSHVDTIGLKEKLVSLGYGGMNINESYGSFTSQQVRKFQTAYGLKAHGIADEITLLKIDEMLKQPDTLRVGDKHASVIDLKKKLIRLGFGGMNINESYGSFTAQRVREFQSHFGLTANGVTNRATFSKLEEILNTPLQVGKRHNDIISIKRKLNSIGYGGISVTNYFGEFMERRVKELQRDLRLPVSGIIDSITRAAIDNFGPLSGKIIVLDPGHGGKDSGATANNLIEKQLNLDIALRTMTLLEAQGATVIMTRSSDVYLSLEERAAIANNSKAHIFISIHANKFNGSANGTETFWHSKYQSSNSIKLANAIQNSVVEKMGTSNRRVAEGNFHVIRETKIPSALLEVAFMDHSGDSSKLKQVKYLQLAAEGIYKGIINYFK